MSLILDLRQQQPDLQRLIGDIVAGPFDGKAKRMAALAVGITTPVGKPETPSETDGAAKPEGLDKPGESGDEDDATEAPAAEVPAPSESAELATIQRKLRIALLPFTADAESQSLALLAAELLRYHLLQAPSLDVAPRNDVAAVIAKQADASPHQWAQAVQAPVWIVGRVSRHGEQATILLTIMSGEGITNHPQSDAFVPAMSEVEWTAPGEELFLHSALAALNVIRALGVNVPLQTLERLSRPITHRPTVAKYWALALTAERESSTDAAVRYYQLALEAQPGFRPALDGLAALMPSATIPADLKKVADALAPFKAVFAIARQTDPSLPLWLTHHSPADRDAFSALAFSADGSAGLDTLLEALFEVAAAPIVLRVATGLLESHLCREDTPLPQRHVQWRMPLNHPGNRWLFDREQKRAYLCLCRARAELACGHVEEARDIADYVVQRFAHLSEIAAYAQQLAKDLSVNDSPVFREHRRDTAQRFDAIRTAFDTLYLASKLGEVPRQTPAMRVRAWAAERPAVSWDNFGANWEEFNRQMRQSTPRLFSLAPDAVERELLGDLAAEWRHATTPNAKRMTHRWLAWLGPSAVAELQESWLPVPTSDLTDYATVLAGLVRGGSAPDAQAMVNLVTSDPLAAARLIRSLTPAVGATAAMDDVTAADLELPETQAERQQATLIPNDWRPALWQCLDLLPKSATAEAQHLVAVLGLAPLPTEETSFVNALKLAPEPAAAALLKLKSTAFPSGEPIPHDQDGWCLAWRSRFKAQGPATLVDLLPEGPGWMMALGKQLSDLFPLAMLAPTRLATEVSKRRKERGYPDKDMLYIEELAAGAMAADTRPQTAKVAALILDQIIQRWPPWELTLGDHVWLFGTLERLKNENDPESSRVVMTLGSKTLKALLDLEPAAFDEKDLARERYYSDEQLLLVEIMKRVAAGLAHKASPESRQLLSDVVTKLKLPAQGNLLPFVEMALAAQGAAILDTIEGWLNAPDPFNVGVAHRLLRKLGGAQVNDRLVAWLASDKPVLRVAAFETLRLRQHDALEVISTALLSPEPRVHGAACDLLARLRPGTLPADFDLTPVTGILVEAKDSRVLRSACLAAAVHDAPDAFEAVAARLVNWPTDNRLELLEAAAATGKTRAYPYLIRALQSEFRDEAHLAYGHLLRISGQVLAKDPAPWAMWWALTADELALPKATLTVPARQKQRGKALLSSVTRLPTRFELERELVAEMQQMVSEAAPVVAEAAPVDALENLGAEDVVPESSGSLPALTAPVPLPEAMTPSAPYTSAPLMRSGPGEPAPQNVPDPFGDSDTPELVPAPPMVENTIDEISEIAEPADESEMPAMPMLELEEPSDTTGIVATGPGAPKNPSNPVLVPFQPMAADNPLGGLNGAGLDEFGFAPMPSEGPDSSASISSDDLTAVVDQVRSATQDESDTDATGAPPLIEESSLLQAPVNDVTGAFPLASLHGHGVGQWLSTNPDRFLAEGPVWFLIGRPEVENFVFVCPFYLVNGTFEVVLAPDDRGGFATVRIDPTILAPNNWWTLMVERNVEQAWFRIAERDANWTTLETASPQTPVAAVGIAFSDAADVAFGDLSFEPQQPRRIFTQITPRKGPRRK